MAQGLVVDADGDELGQPGPRLVEHPEGAVAASTSATAASVIRAAWQ
jgi:hypothetical protein